MLTFKIYIYIERERERVRLKWVMTHQIFVSHAPNLEFESSNDRSEPFNLFFILKYLCRPNFTFFWNFFLFYPIGQSCINPTISGVSISLIFDLLDKIEKNFEKM